MKNIFKGIFYFLILLKAFPHKDIVNTMEEHVMLKFNNPVKEQKNNPPLAAIFIFLSMFLGVMPASSVAVFYPLS